MTALTRRQALAAASTTALSACTLRSPAALAGVGAGPRIGEAQATALLESVAANLLALSPESATSLGIDKGDNAALRSQLSDRSPAGVARIAAVIRSDLARVQSLDLSALTPSTRTSIEVIRSAYGSAAQGFAQPYGDVAVGGWRNAPYVVIQNVGAYLDLPRFLDSDHQIDTAADAEAYLSRLASAPAQLDGETARIIAAREKGLLPPSFLLDKALPQLRQSLAGAKAGGTLVESITRRTREKNLAGNWEARARAVAAGPYAAALERQVAELERQRALASPAPGMAARPGGADYYRWALKASTTTDLSPEEIHQIGLTELRELQGRMDPILKGLGYTNGSVGTRMQALGRDPRYRFAEGDKGRAEILAFIQERLKLVRAKLPQMFNTLVRGNLEVRRLPPEEEPGAPGAYGGAGSIDGSIPGKFWINLRETSLHTKFDLPDLTHHESIPGHVWQGEYANKLPLIRTMLAFNAYSEGWALYAQQLADEFGLYDDFPAGRLGYLQGIAFRACRLVVDTGLHAKGWSREQAVRFFMDENGTKESEARSEVDRYCSWPGQACGYKIGHTAINRQRTRAQAALGDRFDIRFFNDAVLLGGNVPMDVLALNVGEYIRGKGGTA
ncbi:uncharacterized protein (DUF885 family) [Sphingomonas kaistensis]|uniref:Uncharacterized protein (DUF885 family) n=1 Tax=Sphingomonas kaistensis TaxID=298708 RepID=A0A7X6BFZ6_9SPHN|nr:DUF885 domain-containing protein [Sphingomonas kaistensis]NJC05919.1 uncharacterized protein (DUF885 family) [Sphingomonas kaistensis]